MITLTDKRLSELLDEVRADLVQRLLTEQKTELDYISQTQVCGLLDISLSTLTSLKLPRYVLIPKKVVRYKLSEVMAFVKASRE